MKRVGWLSRIVVAVAVLASLMGGRVEAKKARFDPHFPFGDADTNGSAMIGVTSDQTARLNVVNIGVPANTCQVDLSWIDERGNVLTQSSISLAPHVAAHLDLIPPSGSSPRNEVRSLVHQTSKADCAVLNDVEVFDSRTQKSDLVIRGDPTW